jgi:holin-like protein
MKLLKQFGIIMGVYVGCEIFLMIVPIRFPANVLGMLVMFALLCAKIVKLDQIEEVAGFLTTNLGFFFIPAGVSIASNFGLVKEIIFPILIICLFGTALVFTATVFTARGIQKLSLKKHAKINKEGIDV